MTIMTTKNCGRRWLMLLFSFCLWSCIEANAQQRIGGGGNGGGGGGFGGNGGNRGNTSSSSSSSSAGSTRDYQNNTMIGDATVTVDPETRRVIVVTDEQTALNVSQVISNLDHPKPQVLIKVVFLEVTHNDALDIGIEGSYNHTYNPFTVMTNIAGGFVTNFSGNPVSAQAGNNFGLAAQGTSGSLIGGNQMPTGAGIYSVLGSDFSATLRAIASAGKSEILSRPSILVRNNQPATITVGQSVPLVTSVTYNALNGQPISTISYQNVGIILQVTPFITADGLVEMIVAPQISSLASQQVQIASGINAPTINLRSASTVVVTPDGETVVIGGLMETDKATVDTKVPILGDIPGLGVLFRRHQKSNIKTELLIFLTPHVVQMPSQLARASALDNSKAELAPKAFSEQEFNKFFDTLPLKKVPASDKHQPDNGNSSRSRP
jgi:general secretion pathway protein D